MNILFVCTGNTCRSAMAQAIAKQLIKSDPHRYGQIKVASAGTCATDGAPASANALLVVQAHDVDLTDFRSQQVSPELLTGADLILAMTNDHKRLLGALNPATVDKTFLLKEYEYGQNANELLYRLNQLFGEYNILREKFILEHQEVLKQLDTLSKTDQTKADKQFAVLDQELSALLEPSETAIKAVDDQLKALEIPDPFGGSLDDYQQCYDVLAESIKAIFDKLTQKER